MNIIVIHLIWVINFLFLTLKPKIFKVWSLSKNKKSHVDFVFLLFFNLNFLHFSMWSVYDWLYFGDIIISVYFICFCLCFVITPSFQVMEDKLSIILDDKSIQDNWLSYVFKISSSKILSDFYIPFLPSILISSFRVWLVLPL